MATVTGIDLTFENSADWLNSPVKHQLPKSSRIRAEDWFGGVERGLALLIDETAADYQWQDLGRVPRAAAARNLSFRQGGHVASEPAPDAGGPVQVQDAQADHLSFLRSIQGLSRPERQRQFLARLVKERAIAPHLATIGANYIADLRKRLALDGITLAGPVASAGPDGSLNFAWRAGDNLLSLRLSQDECGEFAFVNTDTGEMWECEFTLMAKPVDDGALRGYLRRFAAAR